MRKAGLTLALLAVASSAVWAQKGSIPDQLYHQTPDSDGVYFVGPEVSAPTLAHPVPAIYTDEMVKSKVAGMSTWLLVIRADGTPTDAHVVQALGTPFDQAAVDAINRSKFEPGKLTGKPVDVRVGVIVPFRYGKYPSTPFIAVIERDLDPTANGWNSANSQPAATHTVSASFSSDAIKARYQGIALISTLVGTDGLPGAMHVTRPIGMGLDQVAIDAVKRYRFRPAMRDGTPVPAQINVEVSFLIY